MAKKKFSIRTHEKSKSSIGSAMAAAAKQSIQILPELKRYIRALKDSEYAQLEKSILAEGCLDPIKVWVDNDGKQYIIDGHNRFSICEKHHLPYEVERKELNSIEEVKEYMINLQLGRRNLNNIESSYYRGLHYNMQKAKDNLGRAATGGKLSEALAEEHGVNEKTIRRDASVAEIVDLLPEIERALYLAGESGFTKARILEASKQLDKIEDLVSFLKGEVDNKEVIQPRERVVDYLDSYKKKVDSQFKGWSKHLSSNEKEELASHLESILRELRKN